MSQDVSDKVRESKDQVIQNQDIDIDDDAGDWSDIPVHMLSQDEKDELRAS